MQNIEICQVSSKQDKQDPIHQSQEIKADKLEQTPVKAENQRENLDTVRDELKTEQSNNYLLKTDGKGSAQKRESINLQIKDFPVNNEKNKKPDERLFVNPIVFYLKVINASCCCLFFALALTIFNTLGSHLPYIYKLKSEDEQTNLLQDINAFPQLVAAFVAIFSGQISASIGRRKFLMFLNIIVIIGTVLTIIDSNQYDLIAGRLLIGIGLGGWSCIGPVYANEISPQEWKGYSGLSYSWFFGFGSLLSFTLGLGLPDIPEDPDYSTIDTYNYDSQYWRVMLSILGILNLVQLLVFIFFFKDETYTFTFLKSLSITQQDKKKQYLESAIGKMSKEFRRRSTLQEVNTLQNIVESIKQSKTQTSMWYMLFGARYRYQFWLAVFVAFASNYTGSNAINIYSYDIISKHNSSGVSTLFTTLLPVCDLCGPLFSFRYLNRVGRKGCIQIGQITIAVVLFAFSMVGWSGYYNPQKYLILLFKMIFAASTAPIQWVYPAEILQAQQMGVWGCFYWLLSTSATYLYPVMEKSSLKLEGSIFVFCAITVLTIFVLQIYMIEIVGQTKDQIEKLFYKYVDKQVEIIKKPSQLTKKKKSSSHNESQQ